MPDLKNITDYAGYTFEQLLEDERFLSFVKNPDPDSARFWETNTRENIADEKELRLARKFIQECVARSERSVSEAEIAALRRDIDITNRRQASAARRRSGGRIVAWAAGAAACAALLFFGTRFLLPGAGEDLNQQLLMSFVEANETSIESHDEIKVMVAENSFIGVETEEAEIIYDVEGIRLSEQRISRESIAEFNQLIVPKGKRSRLVLSDGTAINVNSGTRLVYPTEFFGERREIYVDGEVFIDVARDENFPFVVRTGSMTVEVLGTKFNVMAFRDEERQEIVLINGSVKVTTGDEDTGKELKPNQMFRLAGGQETILTVDPERYISWVDGIYFCDSEKLDALMRSLSRYYGKRIGFDVGIATLRCSGRMDMKEDLGEVLKGLEHTFPIVVESTGDGYYVKLDLK